MHMYTHIHTHKHMSSINLLKINIVWCKEGPVKEHILLGIKESQAITNVKYKWKEMFTTIVHTCTVHSHWHMHIQTHIQYIQTHTLTNMQKLQTQSKLHIM